MDQELDEAYVHVFKFHPWRLKDKHSNTEHKTVGYTHTHTHEGGRDLIFSWILF